MISLSDWPRLKKRAGNLVLLVTVGLSLAPTTSAIAASGWGATMKTVDFQNCYENRCLTIKASEARGSQLKFLFTMKDVELQIVERTGLTKHRFTAHRGYFDLENEMVVIREIKGRALTDEISVSLRDLTLRDWGK